MDEKQKQLQDRIRSLTKQIGEARRAHRREELSNLRAQRNGFARQLAEEFDTYFVIRNGSTFFVSQEEMMEHYSDPEERKKVRGSNIVSQLFEQRQWYKRKLDWVKSSSDEDLREYLETTFEKQMKGREAAIHDVQGQIGEEPMDFDVIDARAAQDAELLDGIDLSSLLDNHGNDKEKESG